MFENPCVEAKVILSDEFEEECRELRFRDNGHEIFLKCGEACCKVEQLEKIIDKIKDVEFLGSMIYSNWLYFKKFACYPEDVLLHKNRKWFICALNRMRDLVINGYVNYGKVRKIELVSYIYKVGSYIQNITIKEKLTINSKGRIWINKYEAEGDKENYKLVSKETMSIDKTLAKDVLEVCNKSVSRERKIYTYGDRWEYWNMTITGDDGYIECLDDMAGDIITENGCDLSEYIRCQLDRPDLMLFDMKNIDNPIENITLEYNREQQIVDEGIYSTTDEKKYLKKSKRYELLTSDRKTGKIEYLIDKDGNITEFNIKNKLMASRLLNFFSRNNLFQVSHIFFMSNQKRKEQKNTDIQEKAHNDGYGEQSKTVDKSYDIKTFELKVRYRDGSEKKFYGNFDRNHLPYEYESFIDLYKKVITLREKGDLFDPKLYKKGKAMSHEFIYCSVSFNNSSKTYYYIADNDDFSIGDLVDVPVGNDGQTVVGKIEDINFYTKTKVPFDIEKTKHIVGKHLSKEKDFL